MGTRTTRGSAPKSSCGVAATEKCEKIQGHMPRGHQLDTFLTAPRPGQQILSWGSLLYLKHHSQAGWPRIPAPAGWVELPILGTKNVAPLEKAKEDGSWRKVPPPGWPKRRERSESQIRGLVWGGSQPGRVKRRGGQQQGLRTHLPRRAGEKSLQVQEGPGQREPQGREM